LVIAVLCAVQYMTTSLPLQVSPDRFVS